MELFEDRPTSAKWRPRQLALNRLLVNSELKPLRTVTNGRQGRADGEERGWEGNGGEEREEWEGEEREEGRMEEGRRGQCK